VEVSRHAVFRTQALTLLVEISRSGLRLVEVSRSMLRLVEVSRHGVSAVTNGAELAPTMACIPLIPVYW